MNRTGHSDDCQCCAGIAVATPSAKLNRAGLPAVAYRVGTYATFRETLLARLSGADFPALQGLRTRSPNDFTIALCDCFSVLADVLTFYQERIANESYLRTATERLSVHELAALIGYRLAPGVAASTTLAFQLESAPGSPELAAQPVTIPAGTRVQSVPDADQAPQTFETVAAITGRVEWNAIPVQQWEAVPIEGGKTVEIYVAGTDTQLQHGDPIVIVGDERLVDVNSDRWDLRWVERVEVDRIRNVTRLVWSDPLGSDRFPSAPSGVGIRVYTLRQRASLFGSNAPESRLVKTDKNETTGLFDGDDWKDFSIDLTGKKIDLDASYPKVVKGSWFVLVGGETSGDDAGYVELYKASGVSNRSQSRFGLSAKITRLRSDSTENLGKFELRTALALVQSDELTFAERPLLYPLYGNVLAFDLLVPGLAPGQFIALSGKRQRVKVGPSAVGVTFSGNLQRQARPGESFIMLAAPSRVVGGVVQAPPLSAEELDPTRTPTTNTLRWTVQDHDGSTIEIDALDGLLLLTPARDKDKIVNEVVGVASVADSIDGEDDRTTAVLDVSLVNCYDRWTTTVNANVAPATHGETVSEILGNGNAGAAGQTFGLKQSPLTYVSDDDDPSGRSSTLKVDVGGVTWREVASFYGGGPLDRVYVVSEDNEGNSTVAFGTGERGARLPTGQNNLRATYRKGLGATGNLRLGQLTTLLTRPLGVKSVTNLQTASGGQDPENLSNARVNAPLRVLTLDRAVSIDDYADFARTFAGIAKACAVWIPTVPRGIHVTVAGVAGAAVLPESATGKNLLGALRKYGDPLVPLQVQSYGAAQFRMKASVKIADGADAKVVLASVESALRAAFAFDARALVQPVALDEIYAVIHAVSGVVAAEVISLYRSNDAPAATPPIQLHAAPPTLGDDGAVKPAEILTLDSVPLDLGVMT